MEILPRARPLPHDGSSESIDRLHRLSAGERLTDCPRSGTPELANGEDYKEGE
jgi:hypothetical protein